MAGHNGPLAGSEHRVPVHMVLPGELLWNPPAAVMSEVNLRSLLLLLL